MTVLHLADEGEAADLAAFLSRLLHKNRKNEQVKTKKRDRKSVV